jgi:hypothetical protein
VTLLELLHAPSGCLPRLSRYGQFAVNPGKPGVPLFAIGATLPSVGPGEVDDDPVSAGFDGIRRRLSPADAAAAPR